MTSKFISASKKLGKDTHGHGGEEGTVGKSPDLVTSRFRYMDFVNPSRHPVVLPSDSDGIVNSNWYQRPDIIHAVGSALENSDIVIAVEHCSHCHEHVSTKHDPAKYITKANEAFRHLAEVIHDCHLSVRCGVIRCPITSEKRIGAFEVFVVYRILNKTYFEIIHSKLISKMWPSAVNMERKLRAFIQSQDIPGVTTMHRQFCATHVGPHNEYPAGFGPWRFTALADPDWSYELLPKEFNGEMAVGHGFSSKKTLQTTEETLELSAPKIFWVFDSQLLLGYRFDVGTLIRISGLSWAVNCKERHPLVALTTEYCDTRMLAPSSPKLLKIQLKYHDDFCTVEESQCEIVTDVPVPSMLLARPSDVQMPLELMIILLLTGMVDQPQEFLQIRHKSELLFLNQIKSSQKKERIVHRSKTLNPDAGIHHNDSKFSGVGTLVHFRRQSQAVKVSSITHGLSDTNPACRYRSRQSFFHYIRNTVNSVESYLRMNRKESDVIIKEPFSNRVFDLQLSYAEEVISWVFDLFPDDVDMKVLGELARSQSWYLLQYVGNWRQSETVLSIDSTHGAASDASWQRLILKSLVVSELMDHSTGTVGVPPIRGDGLHVSNELQLNGVGNDIPTVTYDIGHIKDVDKFLKRLRFHIIDACLRVVKKIRDEKVLGLTPLSDRIMAIMGSINEDQFSGTVTFAEVVEEGNGEYDEKEALRFGGIIKPEVNKPGRKTNQIYAALAEVDHSLVRRKEFVQALVASRSIEFASLHHLFTIMDGRACGMLDRADLMRWVSLWIHFESENVSSGAVVQFLARSIDLGGRCQITWEQFLNYFCTVNWDQSLLEAGAVCQQVYNYLTSETDDKGHLGLECKDEPFDNSIHNDDGVEAVPPTFSRLERLTRSLIKVGHDAYTRTGQQIRDNFWVSSDGCCIAESDFFACLIDHQLNKAVNPGDLDRLVSWFASESDSIRKVNWVNFLTWANISSTAEECLDLIIEAAHELFPPPVENDELIREEPDEMLIDFSTPSPFTSASLFSPMREFSSPVGKLDMTMTASLDDIASKQNNSLCPVAEGTELQNNSRIEILWDIPDKISAGTCYRDLFFARAVKVCSNMDIAEKLMCPIVSGRYVYNNDGDAILTMGMNLLKVIFIPDRSNDQSIPEVVEKAVVITVQRKRPQLLWEVSAATLSLGDCLTAAHLCCKCAEGIDGTFYYSKALGQAMLEAGDVSIEVTFVPSDTGCYEIVSSAKRFFILSKSLLKTQSMIVMDEPYVSRVEITYGMSLESIDLSKFRAIHAGSSGGEALVVPGQFYFSPPLTQILSAGEHRINVSFHPSEVENFVASSASFEVHVLRCEPIINWNLQSRALVVGENLSAVLSPPTLVVGGVLSAVLSPPTIDNNICTISHGSFYFSLPLNRPVVVEDCPEVVVTATFVPNAECSSNILSVSKSQSVLIRRRARPNITWTSPEAISYGIPLSEIQLNAAVMSIEETGEISRCDGELVYCPPMGTILEPGVHVLQVKFIPVDQIKYFSIDDSRVEIVVRPAIPEVSWTPLASNAHDIVGNGRFVDTVVDGKSWVSVSSNKTEPTRKVAFIPNDLVHFCPVYAEIETAKQPAEVEIEWNLLNCTLSFGEPLSSSQLSASAFTFANDERLQVPGSYSYDYKIGDVLNAGEHILHLAFKPDDPLKFNPANAKRNIQVLKVQPRLSWDVPTEHNVLYSGDCLSAAQLCCRCADGIEGKFVYSHGIGYTVDEVGEFNVEVTFIPSDTLPSNYTMASLNRQFSVLPTASFTARNSLILWDGVRTISYGTPLSRENVLKARCIRSRDFSEISGHFSFTPDEGTILNVGTHSILVTFSPQGSMLESSQLSCELTVIRSNLSIDWQSTICFPPIAINQSVEALKFLNIDLAHQATPGKFCVALESEFCFDSAGEKELALMFLPSDPAKYEPSLHQVVINVAQSPKPAESRLLWTPPAPISYGQPLTATELSATVLINTSKPGMGGRIVFDPPIGTILSAGIHSLRARFMPNDAQTLLGSEISVELNVIRAQPKLIWEVKTEHAALSVGDFLTHDQLCCQCDDGIEGRFFYSRGLGQLLEEAGEIRIEATFIPSLSYQTNYGVVSVAKTFFVTNNYNRYLDLLWEPSSVPLVYGDALDIRYLSCAAVNTLTGARIAGHFEYEPALGTILNAGEHILLARFKPDDKIRYPESRTMQKKVFVRQQIPKIVWEPKELALTQNQLLSSAHLNAIATINNDGTVLPGIMTYNPSSGTALVDEGIHTIAVNFQPSKGANNNFSSATFSKQFFVMRSKQKVLVTVAYQDEGDADPIESPEIADTIAPFSSADQSSTSNSQDQPSVVLRVEPTRTPSRPPTQRPVHVIGSSQIQRSPRPMQLKGNADELIPPSANRTINELVVPTHPVEAQNSWSPDRAPIPKPQTVDSKQPQPPPFPIRAFDDRELMFPEIDKPGSANRSQIISKVRPTSQIGTQLTREAKQIHFVEVHASSYMLSYLISETPDATLKFNGVHHRPVAETLLDLHRTRNTYATCRFTFKDNFINLAGHQANSESVRVSIRGMVALAGDQLEFYCAANIQLHQLHEAPIGASMNIKVSAIPKLYSSFLKESIEDQELLTRCKFDVVLVVSVQ